MTPLLIPRHVDAFLETATRCHENRHVCRQAVPYIAPKAASCRRTPKMSVHRQLTHYLFREIMFAPKLKPSN
ncbi:hypothetical protein ACFL1X_09900 [Candidatus Hydrogenedentota bacterium]